MGIYPITLDYTALQKDSKVKKFFREPRRDELKPGELVVNVMNAVNILPLDEKINPKLQKYLEQWKEKVDFHYLDIYFNIKSKDRGKIRGVKKLGFDYRIEDEENETSKIKILDIIPKTEWENKNYKVSLSGEIEGKGEIGFDYKPIDSVNVGIEAKAAGSLAFEYEWNPKIAKIISNAVSFTVNNSDNTFLDGRILMTLLIQRERSVKAMFFRGHGELTFDIKLLNDVRGESSEINEGILFIESKI